MVQKKSMDVSKKGRTTGRATVEAEKNKASTSKTAPLKKAETSSSRKSR